MSGEPHWRVALFASKYDESSKRLLNVGLTRARRHLFLVGDFAYMARHGRKAFLGRQVIPCFERYPEVEAKHVLPSEIMARAAAAQATTSAPVQAASDSLVVTQDQFDDLFLADLEASEKRVVILSAFITRRRLEILGLGLRAAVERGVQVVVITKALEERASRSEYVYLENTLRGWGVIVAHKRGHAREGRPCG